MGGFSRGFSAGTEAVADQRTARQGALNFQAAVRVCDAFYVAQVTGDGSGPVRVLITAQVAGPARVVGKTGGVAAFGNFAGFVEASVLNATSRCVVEHVAVGVVLVA